MILSEFTQNVFYVGVNDQTTYQFENLWPLPYGVTYNSYLVKGSTKNALIESVEISQCMKLIERLRSIDPEIRIDYLVINHMEPDHSGSVSVLKHYFPEMQIVGNLQTMGMLKGYYNISTDTLVVKEGDTLDLGNLTLRFHMTPMLHWPETMMTYLVENKVLFSGDAFGCFGAINGGIVDSEIGNDSMLTYKLEMFRYYANIVAKYGSFVQKALSKLSGIPIDYVCSTHGPIWHERINDVIETYNRLSKNISEEGVVIVYGSMYGHTEEMVDVLARQLAVCGIKNIKIHNISKTHESFILRDIYRYRGLIIACPTYNASIFPPVETLLSSLLLRGTENKVFTQVGSFTWSPAGIKKIAELCQSLKFQSVGIPVSMKQSITADTIAACLDLAKQFASALKQSDATIV